MSNLKSPLVPLYKRGINADHSFVIARPFRRSGRLQPEFSPRAKQSGGGGNYRKYPTRISASPWNIGAPRNAKIPDY